MREVVAAVDVGGTRRQGGPGRPVVRRRRGPDRAHPGGRRGRRRGDRGLGGGRAALARRGTGRDAADAEPVQAVGCGVVVPGLVDERRGVGLWSANLGWRDLPVGDAVTARLRVPTAVGHDVRAGLLAETRLGAARGARHALFLPVGTGIAGALLLEGVLISADGWAGELGHMVVDPAGLPCACGAAGCLETVGSAAAVERAYAATTGRRCSAEQVAALTAAGDPAATRVWERAVSALGAAIAATVTLTGGGPRPRSAEAWRESGETLLGPAARGPRRPADVPAPPRPGAGGPRRPCRVPRRRVPGVGRAVILTVTLNAALDVTYDVDEVVAHRSHRVTAVRQRAGGKGVNVASVLARTGHEVVATGYAGGRTGADLCADLDARGIAHRFVDGGDARRTVTVVSAAHGDATVFNEPGPVVPADAWTSLVRLVRRPRARARRRRGRPLGEPAHRSAGGRVRAAGRGRSRGRRPGCRRRGRRGSARRRHGRTRGGQAQPPRAALRPRAAPTSPPACGVLRSAGARDVVVSDGAEGLLVFPKHGRPLRVWLPDPLSGNPTGAGDALVAAVASGLEAGDAVARGGHAGGGLVRRRGAAAGGRRGRPRRRERPGEPGPDGGDR